MMTITTKMQMERKIIEIKLNKITMKINHRYYSSIETIATEMWKNEIINGNNFMGNH